jgi:O-antigen/teichoic acid export membrane protein
LAHTRLHSLYRADSIALSVGVNSIALFAQRALGLFRGVALVWLMPTAQFGLFGVSLLVANVLLPVCSAGLYEGIARYTPQHEALGSLRRFSLRAGVLVGVIAIATTGVMLLAVDVVGDVLFSTARLAGAPAATSPPTGQSAALTRVALLCVLTLVPYHAVLGVLKGLRMFRALSAMELLAAVLFTAGTLGMAATGWNTARLLMLAYAGSNIVAVLLFLPGLYRHFPQGAKAEPAPSSATPVVSTLLKYSVWAGGTAVLWHALSYYPTWHLLKVTDESTVGTFHAVRMLTQFVQIAAVMLIQVVAATTTRLWEHEGREPATRQLERLTKLALLALLAGATALVVAGPWMMRLLPGKVAMGAHAYEPLVLFFLLVGVIGLVTIRLNLIEKPRLVFAAWLFGCAVNLTLCCVLLGTPADSFAGEAIDALRLAAWSGVWGVTAALLVVLALVHRHHVALPARTLFLIAASALAVAGPVVAAAAFVLLVIVCLGTEVLLTREDREPLRRLVRRMTAR